MSDKDRKVLVIACTYNERENIEALVKKILEHAPQVNVLVIDDNSPDGTGELMDAMSAEDSRVLVMHRPGKLGLGTALVQGLTWARDHGYDTAISMDADFSHDPVVIPRMIEESAGHDYIIGSRYVPGGGIVDWGIHRRILSKGGNLFARMMLGLTTRDLTTGFRCVNLHRLDDIGIDKVQSLGYGFFIETTFRVVQAGITPLELPIMFVDRKFGKSKISGNIAMEELKLVWRLRKERKEKKEKK